MERRVVITGMGIYSCLGKDLDEVRDSLYTGKSGIVFDPARKELGFRSALTAKLDVPDLKGMLPRSQRVYMAEQVKYAYMATKQALDNAKLMPSSTTQACQIWSARFARRSGIVARCVLWWLPTPLVWVSTRRM